MNDKIRRSVGFLVALIGLATAGTAGAHALVIARTAVVDACLAKGITSVHQLDLNELRARILELKYRRAEGEFPKVAGDRRTAYYRAGEVNFNTETFPASFEMISLHEALGALGFEDNEYQKSTALTAICAHPDPGSLIRSGYALWNFQARKSLEVAGGSTVVGGGGDLVAAELKTAVVRAVMLDPRMTILDAVLLTQMEFEPNLGDGSRLSFVPDERAPHRGLIDHERKNGIEKTSVPTYKVLVPKHLVPGTKEFTLVMKEAVKFFARYRLTFLSEPSQR